MAAFKNWRYLLLTTLLALNLSCVDSLGELLQEANYRDRGDRISVEDAIGLVHGSLLVLHLRCPTFSTSPFNWLINYGLVIKNNCDDNYKSGQSDRTRCADYNFLSREDVRGCRLLIETDPCDGETINSISRPRLMAFNFCASTFRAKTPFPLIISQNGLL